MDLIKLMCDAAASKQFKKTQNFYFEDHICEKDGNNKRIRLDNIITSELTDELVRFGVCGDCGTCFYHNDYRSSSL